MKILARKNRELVLINAQNTQNENDAEKILLQVPEQYEDFNKKIVFNTKDGDIWDIIVNNEYLIPKAITKYEQVEFYIWLTKDDVDFRSRTYPLKFYPNIDASEEITPEEIGGVNTIVNLLEAEITKVDNIDIDAEKVGDTATITIINKDGETKSVEIKDGKDGGGGSGGTSNYNNLINKPSINNITLQGNLSASDLGIEEYDDTEIKQDINAATTIANTAKSIAEGANQALSYANYESMTSAFNILADNVYKVGQNVMIITLNVPDLWISSIEETSVTYTYTTDEAITTALQTDGYVQVGYYRLSALETQKVDLTNYYTKTEDNTLLNAKVDKSSFVYNSETQTLTITI